MGKTIPPTVNSHDPAELVSWLQKALRRGLEDDACWVAAELERSGYGPWVFARLTTIASEDVGLADVGIATEVATLRGTYLDERRKRRGGGRLQLLHAELLLARAPKSRLVDWAVLHYFGPLVGDREPPEWAIDKHTVRGRQRGVGWKEFFEAGTVLSGHVDLPRESDLREQAWAAVNSDDVAPAAVEHEDTEPTLFDE